MDFKMRLVDSVVLSNLCVSIKNYSLPEGRI